MKQTIKIDKIDNTVLISESLKSNSSILGVFVKIGSDYESRLNNGISHLVEHMLFKGTKTRDAKNIALDIEKLGVMFNAYTSRDHTCYYFKSLPESMCDVIDIFKDIINNSLISSNEIKKEKSVIMEEIKSSEDDPVDYVFQELNSLLFKNTSLAQSILGTMQSLQGIEREDVVKFINSYYTDNNIFIVYVGPSKHEDIKKYLKGFIGRSKGKSIKRIKRIVKIEPQIIYKYRPSLSQFHVAMGNITAEYSSKDKFPLIILSAVLGGGMSSRLFSKLREEKGYVYNVYSYIETFLDSGVFGVYFACDYKNIKKVSEIVKKEILEIKNGNIKIEEINKVKTQIIAGSKINFDKLSGRLGFLARNWLYFEKLRFFDEVIDEIQNVRIDDIIDASKKHVDYDKFNISILGNKKNFLYE